MSSKEGKWEKRNIKCNCVKHEYLQYYVLFMSSPILVIENIEPYLPICPKNQYITIHRSFPCPTKGLYSEVVICT